MISKVLVVILTFACCSCIHLPSIPFAPLHQRGGSWDNHQAVNIIPKTLVRTLDGSDSMRRKFEELCRNAQTKICTELERIDGGATFRTDAWTRPAGGGGISRVLSNGNVFEKAGVSTSVVYGEMPQDAIAAATTQGIQRVGSVPFFACGISSVLHPRNPHCPTLHFNYRYFETENGHWWFGGGTDITPSYLDTDDISYFHSIYKHICDKHDATYYPTFKQNADKYFVIPHRNETRGLGGIFFDDLNQKPPEKLFDFAKDCLYGTMPAYVPIIEKHKEDAYSAQEKTWQQLRRGRYVEFNLVYDRGTIFGLKTGGRTESILMSLPETARWEYGHEVQPGSREDEIVKLFKQPRDWV